MNGRPSKRERREIKVSKILQRILYIEDEQDIQTVARLSLELVGRFSVTTCSSGKEALDAYSGDFFDLVLLDVMMPDMDGPETLLSLRKVPGGAEVPAIFMTAKVQPNEIAKLKGLGALGVIPKPFDPMKLPETIQTIWAEKIS